jgi:hypothetical protein
LGLGLSFFGLSTHNRKDILDEIYYLNKLIGFSYSDIQKMPTYERKYFINKLIEELEAKQKKQ